MLYDLNLAWSPSIAVRDINRTLRFSASLGYDVVALDHTLYPPYGPKVSNPIPVITGPESAQQEGCAPAPIAPASSLSVADGSRPRAFPSSVLRRCTVTLSDAPGDGKNGGPHIPARFLTQLASEYDIVALRPTSERALTQVCLDLAQPGQLVSLDPVGHWTFHLPRRAVAAAVARGVRFEVCYAGAFPLAPGPAGGSGSAAGGVAASAEDTARRRTLFVSNLVALLRATSRLGAGGGGALVVSSGASAASPLALRAPADVANLLAVWGLPTDRALAGMGTVARSVVVNEGLRRRAFRGVVRVVEVPAAGDDAKDGLKDVAGNKRDEKEATDSASARKRKDAPGVVAGGITPVGGQQQAEGQPMSKRQAKKMRLAALKAANAA